MAACTKLCLDCATLCSGRVTLLTPTRGPPLICAAPARTPATRAPPSARRFEDDVMRACAEACRRAAEQCRQVAAA